MKIPCYDIAIVGLGPAGTTLARLLDSRFSVFALDKKRAGGEGAFRKPCGGLLARILHKKTGGFSHFLLDFSCLHSNLMRNPP
jgi:flavin-dependent dehydrogenase